jgi:hypothetical protein
MLDSLSIGCPPYHAAAVRNAEDDFGHVVSVDGASPRAAAGARRPARRRHIRRFWRLFFRDGSIPNPSTVTTACRSITNVCVA